MYAYRKNNQWYRCNLSSRFNGVGGFHLLTDEERAKHDFYRCTVVNEQYDTKTQNRSEIPMEWELNGLVVTATYTIIDKDVEQSQRELIAAKIKEGEAYITKTISDMVTALNAKYGVGYKDIYAVGLYGNSPTYPLATQCKAIWDWNELMWATARANQPKVLDGTMTDAEFVASLPIAPEV